jgi:hypothetical protein
VYGRTHGGVRLFKHLHVRCDGPKSTSFSSPGLPEVLNRTDVYPWNHKEVVFSHGVTVLECNVIVVLGKWIRKPTFHCVLGNSAHLEDYSEAETLIRRYPAEDAFCHRFANLRRSRREVRHGDREGKPRITRETDSLPCAARRPDQSGCKVAAISETTLPTPSPGDAAGIWQLIIHQTLTRPEDQGATSNRDWGPRADLHPALHDLALSSLGHTLVILQQAEALQLISQIHVGHFRPERGEREVCAYRGGFGGPREGRVIWEVQDCGNLVFPASSGCDSSK